MSILIKGMEMPKPFDHLFVGKTLRVICMVRNKTEDGDDVVWYPLIEIPPHGRLIDADELYKAIKRLHVGFYAAYEKDKKDERMAALLELDLAARMVFDDAPTIIPADKEG